MRCEAGDVLRAQTTGMPLGHLVRLTDDTGIIQHAIGPVPDRSSGYTTDDNARALAVTLAALRTDGEETLLSVARTYLDFVIWAQDHDGWFHNFFSYGRQPLPEEPSEDCQGRATWACSLVMRAWPDPATARVAGMAAGDGLLRWGRELTSVRGLAWATLALSACLDPEWPGLPLPPRQDYLPVMTEPDPGRTRDLLHRAAGDLLSRYGEERGTNWYWFENELRYDNGLMPWALFRAYDVTGRPSYLRVARESLDFLLSVTLDGGHLTPVGNRGWYPCGGVPARFDQQPIDAAGTVLACAAAAASTGRHEYVEAAGKAWGWFLGENDAGEPLADLEAGTCCDGLGADGINGNQGAESLLSFLVSFLVWHQILGGTAG